ncbi:DMT family transporter [Azospirillum rugosum]|uniref:Drug/metabolite transporter (DMT)-like permease n=1 Tax=Azospirillum rugosum TaxID=416170 RepID=A0ABS4SSP8_9PROT|nr:DMT family transporter [Azospirillum rugosum]MBP2295588.1 drug/metabolite transporter (DMT)-like permease [Azospirillum rugosum]MDQ0529522.1 drug/metabolite transporter (DMT)-like permease [Azospirillum rugosum]
MGESAPSGVPGGAPSPGRRLVDQAWFLMMLPPLFWASNAVLGRAVAGEVPPIGLAFWRWALGALLVLPFAWRHLRQDARTLATHWKIVALLSLTGITVFNTFLYIGLNSTTALNSVMIQSSMPVLIVLMSFALFGDRVSPRQGLGVAVSLAGACTLIARGDPAVLLGLQLNAGDLWVFAAVLGYGTYTALLRRRPAVHPLSFVAVTFGVGMAMLLPFYLWESLAVRPMPLTPTALGAVAYVALFPSILAYLCFNRSVALVGANTAGLAIHLIPVFGSLLAILFLGEQPHLYHAVGIALIAAGILLATRKRG